MHPSQGTWPTTQACALTGNQTGDPLVCRPVLNPQSHSSQGRKYFSLSNSYPQHLKMQTSLFISTFLSGWDTKLGHRPTFANPSFSVSRKWLKRPKEELQRQQGLSHFKDLQYIVWFYKIYKDCTFTCNRRRYLVSKVKHVSKEVNSSPSPPPTKLTLCPHALCLRETPRWPGLPLESTSDSLLSFEAPIHSLTHSYQFFFLHNLPHYHERTTHLSRPPPFLPSFTRL